MDISSDKLMKSHTRRPRDGQERETSIEFLLIAAQINAIRTNYVKTKID